MVLMPQFPKGQQVYVVCEGQRSVEAKSHLGLRLQREDSEEWMEGQSRHPNESSFTYSSEKQARRIPSVVTQQR